MAVESDSKLGFKENIIDKVFSEVFQTPPPSLWIELSRLGRLYEKVRDGKITDPAQIETIKDRSSAVHKYIMDHIPSAED